MAPRASSGASGRPILCAVLDGAALGAGLGTAPGAGTRERAEALFAAGVDWIQLRDRSLEAAPLLALARSLVHARDRIDACAPRTADPHARHRIVVNKRLDVALAAGADGVHLGLDALAPADAAAALQLALVDRQTLRDRLELGASIHSLAELEALIAADLPLRTVQLAPIWSPRSKPAERPALGLAVLARAAALARASGRRVIAQGGLDAARAEEAIRAGASGIAVTGILTQASDPFAAAAGLRQALDRAATPGAAATRATAIPTAAAGEGGDASDASERGRRHA